MFPQLFQVFPIFHDFSKMFVFFHKLIMEVGISWSLTPGKRRNWDLSKNQFNQFVIASKAWLLELGIGNEVKKTKIKPHHVVIKPHSEDTRQHNSVTTLRNDKCTKHNLTTSVHHNKPHHRMKLLHHIMIKTHHVRTTLQDMMK